MAKDTMDQLVLFLHRLQILVQHVNLTEDTLKVAQCVDPALVARADKSFTEELRQLRCTLDDLEKQVKANGAFQPEWWGGLSKVRERSDYFSRECLALLQGALIRSKQVDNGLCLMADAFLQEISESSTIDWHGFTVLSDHEFFADMAEIIRLRFPEVSIWNLPITVHELGHFIAPRLAKFEGGRRLYPLKMAPEDVGGSKKWAYRQERFADLFATYACGPAFPCACILMRFDPASAPVEYEDHPSSAERVNWILKGLRQMDTEGAFEHVIAVLESSWQQTLPAIPPPAEAWARNDETLIDWYNWLVRSLPDLRYTESRWLRAKGLAKALIHPGSHCELSDCQMLDVINGAWCARLGLLMEGRKDNTDAIHCIGKEAYDLCQYVLGRRMLGDIIRLTATFGCV